MILFLFFGCMSEKPTLMDTGSPIDMDTDTTECETGETLDCYGSCSPSWWLADGECDTVFNCEKLQFDEGDYEPIDPPDTEGCSTAPDIGIAGGFHSERFDVE